MAKTKNKLSPKTILLFVTYTALTLTSATTFDGLFAFGAFVGALYGANPLIVAVVYLASGVVFGWQYLLQCAVRCVVMLTFVAIHHFTKRKIGKLNLLLYVLLANVFYLVYGFTDYFTLFDKILYTICGVAFSIVCLYVFRAVFVRGLAYRPQLDERICICLFVVVATFCMSKITIFSLEMVYFLLPFAILLCQSCFDDKTTLVTSVLFGLGNLLATGNYHCLAFCSISALVTVAFGKISRYLSAVGVVAVDVAMSYFLGLHGNFYAIAFAPTLTSVLIFAVIPTKVYNSLHDCFCGNAIRYSAKSLHQKLTQDLSKRLFRLADIFMSIKNAFYTLSVGKVTKQQVVCDMVKQCSQTVCNGCPQKNYCWREKLPTTEKALLELSQRALEGGKCTILDIPQTISAKCDRVAMLISQVNSLAQTHKQFVAEVTERHNNRLLVADQMSGVSNLLLQLASDYKNNLTFDTTRETDLKESLVFHNVLCSDVMIVTQAGCLSVVVTVAKTDLDNATIEKCVALVTKQPMVVFRVESTQSDRWVNVFLRVKPRFEVSFGVSAVTKQGSELSADTHSQIYTDNGKCILSLCDGMGSGVKAEQMSNTVMTLVESFYRADFESDTILSAVNNLLTQSGNEIFCAMDMLVLDLYNGCADFVKLGATVGFVKCASNVEIVNGSSLPLGVLEEMKPSVTKKILHSGDMVVLVSDGIADCYKDANALAEVFYNTTYTAPQSVAESILAKTLKKCNNVPPDDMTVVVAKII